MEPTSTPEPTPTPAPANPEFPNAFAKDVKGDWDLADKRWHDSIRYIKSLEAQVAAKQPDSARVDPSTAAAARPTTIEALANELAVDPTKLAGAIAEVASVIANDRIGVIERSISARANVAREFPNYSDIETKVIEFLEQNPNIRAQVEEVHGKGLPEVALRLAVREYEAAQPKALPVNPTDRALAGLPAPNGAAAKPTAPAPEPSEDEFVKLLQYAHRTHDNRPALTYLFRPKTT